MDRRRSLMLGALLAGTCLSAPAFAQTTQAAPPPLYNNADDLGIDLTTGEPNISFTEGSIGPKDGGIAFIRTWTAGALWTDNWTGGAFSKTVGGVKTWYVEHGGVSETFTQSGSTFVNNEGTGATFDGTTYTSADGTTTTYTNFNIDPNGYMVNGPSCSGDQNTCHVPTKIVQPNGITYTLSWDFIMTCPDGSRRFNCGGRTWYRLTSIQSSAGYKLTASYQVNSFTGSAPPTGWFIKTGMQYANTLAACGATCPSVTYPNSSDYVVDDALGREWQFSGGLLTRIRRPGSSSDNVTITYDANYHVSSVALLGIGTWTYHFVDSGSTRTATITDPLSHTKTATSDLNTGRITNFKDALGRNIAFDYDSNGRLQTVTRYTTSKTQYSLETQYSYDSRGNVETTTVLPAYNSTGLANIVTSAAYPPTCTNQIICNKPTSTTDANNNTTSYSYDPTHGGVTSITQPAVNGVQPQTRFSYSKLDQNGNVTTASTGMYKLTGVSACQTTASCSGTADEVKHTIVYGTNLLPTSIATGAGDGSLNATTSLTYDPAGNVAAVDGPLTGTADTTHYFYDADHELTEMVGPDPDGAGALKNRAQRRTYSPDGLVTLAEQGTANPDGSSFVSLQQVATTYDAGDRKVEDAATAGGTTYAAVQYSYDAANRLDCTAQRMNPATFASLPASACSLATTGSYGPDRITRNSYDQADELLSVTDGYGSDPIANVTYTYTTDGKVGSVADGKGNLTTYLYDGFDRLSKTEYPSPTTVGQSNPSDYEQLGYDPNGNVVSRRLRDGSAIGYSYDALNRLTAMNLPATGNPTDSDTSYSYDLLGHLLLANDINGHKAQYSYDALGRQLTEASAWATKGSQYDLAGRRTRLTWQDGFYVTYDYDNVGEMTAIRENGASSGIGVLATFAYDDLGRRTSRTLGNGTSTSYGFDPISRLTSLALAGGTNPNTTTLTNYSPAGEIGDRAISNDAFAWTQGVNTNRGYTTNGLNQYSAVAGNTQGYDARGNLTSSNGVTYTYNSKNQMSASGTHSFYYDALGRLDTEDTTRLDYDGADLITELNTSNTILRRYVFGPGTDEPIVWYEGSGTTGRHWLDQDERGSITRITSDTGATDAINTYDEYGIPASTNIGRFQYTGQIWLPEIGMYGYKARFYSPSLGRFMQTDPIGYGDGPNWYNYVGSDPVNFIDPTGLAGETCHDGTVFTAAQVAAAGDSDPCDSHGGGATIDVNGNSGTGGGGGAGIPGNEPPPMGNTNPAPGGGGGSTPPPNKKTPTCQRAQKVVNQAVSKAHLPGYLTGNSNWNDSTTLQGYANIYQSNLDEWKAVNSPVGQWVVGTAIGLIPFARGATITAKIAGAALGSAAGVGTASFIQAEINWNQANINAIKARINQLKSGC